MFNYQFTQLSKEQDIKKLASFILKQNLNYPNYNQWVEKAQIELIEGYKKAIIALSDNLLVGNLIYQKHKHLPNVLEVKNMRISPEMREKSFARFMLRQVELEAIKNKNNMIICDVRANQIRIIQFMQNAGYTPVKLISLYDSNQDIILTKSLNKLK